MKKQSATSLFFAMFLRAMVVILGIAIVIMAIVLLTKVVGDDSSDKTTVSSNVLTEPEARDDLLYNSTETTDTAVDTSTTTAEPATATTSYDKTIVVLNSTDVVGLAGRWSEKLRTNGYTNVEASDYETTQATTRIIAREEGVGEDLVQYFSGATYEVGQITSGSSVDVSTADIVIILGTADDDGQ